jgi:hypothetical protein
MRCGVCRASRLLGVLILLGRARSSAGALPELLEVVRSRKSRATVTDDVVLRGVEDDGPGLSPDAGVGRGLHNMRDRIEAVGGRLRIENVDTGGTRIVGRVSAA